MHYQAWPVKTIRAQVPTPTSPGMMPKPEVILPAKDDHSPCDIRLEFQFPAPETSPGGQQATSLEGTVDWLAGGSDPLG